MIKVIASDMDGTLLGDNHKPAPETLAAVKKACRSGIRFMIATGRFPSNLEITDTAAQKGPVLKAYIESLGYTMDEVKKATKYITRSNTEPGVAYAIEELLKRR